MLHSASRQILLLSTVLVPLLRLMSQDTFSHAALFRMTMPVACVWFTCMPHQLPPRPLLLTELFTILILETGPFAGSDRCQYYSCQ